MESVLCRREARWSDVTERLEIPLSASEGAEEQGNARGKGHALTLGTNGCPTLLGNYESIYISPARLTSFLMRIVEGHSFPLIRLRLSLQCDMYPR